MGQVAGGFAGQVSASGTSDPFQLGGGSAGIEVVSEVVSIGAATSVVVALDVLVGGSWTTVATLPGQSAAGAVSAVVTSAMLVAAGVDGATGLGRLRWTVTGTGGANLALVVERV